MANLSTYKVLFVSEAVTLAHVARPYVLANSILKDNTYEIHFACDGRYDNFFSTEKFVRHKLTSISNEEFLNALKKGKPAYNRKTLESYINEELVLINRINPAVVVGDFRLSLAISARLAGVPYVSITNAYWSPYAKPHYYIPNHSLVKIFGPELSQLIFDWLRPVIFAYHGRAINRLRMKYGMESLGNDLSSIYTEADYTLYSDIPELVPIYKKPNNHAYLGAILWSSPGELPSWKQEILTDNKPVIYLSLGSSGDIGIYSEVIQGLAHIDGNVMVATADRCNIIASELPSNFFVSEYIPGGEATSISDLVICNGGSMTVQQSLFYGVPVLGIANNLDQYMNMHYVVNLGAGKLLRSDQASRNKIADNVKQILNQQLFKKNALNISNCFSKYNAVETFEKLLNRIIQGYN